MIMIERVARALWHEYHSIVRRLPPPFPGDWEQSGDTKLQRERFFAMARSAIEALREPTDEIAEAVWAETGDPCWKENAIEAWQAGIDAALAEKS